jgi:phosphatidylinositol alpha-1,6-mannosyltransferase
MRSLFIVNDFPPIVGGQSNYYFNICKAFPDGDLIILAPRSSGFKAFDGMHKLPIVRRPYLVFIPGLEKICKIILPLFYSLPIIEKEKIGCIHCGHVLSTGVVGLILNKWLKLPYIVYTHSADILEFQKYWPIKKLLQCILNNAARISCNSHFTFDQLLKFGVKKGKIRLIYPKTDLFKFDCFTDNQAIIDRYNLSNKKIVLSINRLIERKGNDVMIKAMPLILKEVPDCLYLIAGKGQYENKLKAMVKEARLEKKVIFAEGLTEEEVVKFYKICDVFVMISRTLKQEDTEGFGVSFLEANACGKPVIGGRSGGVPEAVAEGHSGLLVDPLKIEEIAQAVVSLLKDKERALLLGAQGKKRVQDQFDSRFYGQDIKNLMDGM